MLYLTLAVRADIGAEEGFPNVLGSVLLALQGVERVTGVTPAHPLAILQPEERFHPCLVPADPQQNSCHALSCCTHPGAACGYPSFKW